VLRTARPPARAVLRKATSVNTHRNLNYDLPRELTEPFLRFMCRHLVALFGTYHFLSDGVAQGDERAFCYSGCVIESPAGWCYTTAGHVLREQVYGYVERGLVRINRFGLADYFGAAPVVRNPLPFDLDGAEKWYVDDQVLGLDFALVALRDFYMASLDANGVEPITRRNWAGTDRMEFDHFAMIGFPSEFIDPGARDGDRGPQVGCYVAQVLVWIDRIDQVPDGMRPPPATWFMGRVSVPFSMKGMSGGPIFGFRRNPEGQWAYHTIAIQSWWDPQHRVVFGCPIPTFMDHVEQDLQRARQTRS